MAFVGKGAGKGPQPPLVSSTRFGIEVRARQFLSSSEKLETLLEKLSAEIEKATAANEAEGKEVVISDLDISQNRNLTEEDFDRLFSFLAEQNIRVLRIRAFGNPTWDDAVCQRFAEYLETLTAESAPQEIHLSDCSIQCEGFQALVAACDLIYPTTFNDGETTLYLRLENNYIKEETIKEKIDEGSVVAFMKGSKRSTGQEGAKIDLVSFPDRGFKQNEGEPPAPADRPGPKPVNEAWRQMGQQQPMQFMQQQQFPRPQAPFRPPFNAGGFMPQQQQWPAPYQAGGVRPVAVPPRVGGQEVANLKAKLQAVLQQQQQQLQQRPPRPQLRAVQPAAASAWTAQGASQSTAAKPWVKVGAGAAAGAAASTTKWTAPSAGTTWAPSKVAAAAEKGKGKGKGGKVSGGTTWQSHANNDRSRSPAGGKGKVQTNARPPAKGAGKSKAKKLPEGWETHFSDEHKCVYYWNEARQESSWDFPTA